MTFALRPLLFAATLTGSATPAECAQPSPPAPAFAYLGERQPGLKPEIFAPGRLSLPGRREGNATFSPDGRTFFFIIVAEDGTLALQEMRLRGTEGGTEKWSEPQRASFSSVGSNWEASFTPDGQRVYFVSTRPPGTPKWNGRIWTVTRRGDDWSEPTFLEVGITTTKGFWFPTISARNVLYFGAFDAPEDQTAFGKGDLYRVDLKQSPLRPEHTGSVINSAHEEWDAFIAPDESYLLFASDRPGGVGGVDNYVCFREGESWSAPINLGPEVNTPGNDVAAKVTPDGRFMFFDRPTKTEQDMYWVSAEVITRLRPPAK